MFLSTVPITFVTVCFATMDMSLLNRWIISLVRILTWQLNTAYGITSAKRDFAKTLVMHLFKFFRISFFVYTLILVFLSALSNVDAESVLATVSVSIRIESCWMALLRPRKRGGTSSLCRAIWETRQCRRSWSSAL